MLILHFSFPMVIVDMVLHSCVVMTSLLCMYTIELKILLLLCYQIGLTVNYLTIYLAKCFSVIFFCTKIVKYYT